MQDTDMILIKPQQILGESHDSLTLHTYQSLAQQTDFKAREGDTALAFPLLGLFGEVGSLLSELKKKQRDADSYVGYQDSVVEELGDVLWYLSATASRAGLRLSHLGQRAVSLSDYGDTRPQRDDLTFVELQPDLPATGPQPSEAFEQVLMTLAGHVGHTLAEYTAGRLTNNRDALSGDLLAIFRVLIQAAKAAEISLTDAAYGNLVKIFDRWPEGIHKTYPALFDAAFDQDEQLPRCIAMEMYEKTVSGHLYVYQRCNGIKVGDRLTDNKMAADDYRFHDVFHLAYAAILGWSPVIRSLFRVKRKSRPHIDDAEDGARAILIEEGVSTWIFHHAQRLNFFANVHRLDYGLLKAVRALIQGYEVERCPLWLWEEAILEGYKVFRMLRSSRRGIVVADLHKRTVTFEVMP
jgi:NTP pyrophosphatase (non-canonical NTP hydrolase)